MKVLIYGRKVNKGDAPYIQELFDLLRKYQIKSFIYAPYLVELHEHSLAEDHTSLSSIEQISTLDIDLMISLGGDGTILRATTFIKSRNLPILGINLGRLGFLANAKKTEIEDTITQLKEGKYKIQERSMLALNSNIELFGPDDYALNDFTIHKRDNSSMILIHCFINGEILNSYWADGIIVSTPTGSTGYSLSCGGPIMTPSCGNFIIAPVAPHNLNARPIVVSDDSIIKFKVEGRAEYFLCTLDSRYEKITSEHEIELRKAPHPTRLIQLDNHSFLKTIHNKLMWGIDKRNV